jgi:NAD(P)-dependent dehydrogenase (short-subunit alcohol dehydrogenase family)
MRAIEGSVAIVTGASRGIGAATAVRLAHEGMRVVLVARTLGAGAGRLAGSLEQTCAAIAAKGGQAVAVPADLAAEDFDAATVLAEAQPAFGPPDVLVNNAGTAHAMPLLSASARDWTRSLRVNVVAPWALASCAARGMQGRGGAIVNLTSFMGETPESALWPQSGPADLGSLYGAAKAALNRWTVGLAAEVAADGITVNALAPQVAVHTDGADATGHLTERDAEPVQTVVEAVVALCEGDSAVGTGRVRYSLDLLAELGRPVRDLDGRTLFAGWQPEDIAARRATGAWAGCRSGQLPSSE